MGVVAAEPGGNDFAEICLAVAVAILHEEDVGRVGYPDSAVTDGDSGGDVEAFGEDREAVGLAVAVGVFEDLDAVSAGAGLAPGVFEAFGDPGAAALVECHGHGVDDVGLSGDHLDAETGRHGHRLDGLGGRAWRVRRGVLAVRDRLLGRGPLAARLPARCPRAPTGQPRSDVSKAARLALVVRSKRPAGSFRGASRRPE